VQHRMQSLQPVSIKRTNEALVLNKHPPPPFKKNGKPRLCGRNHEGPIYRRLNVGCPSSEVNRDRAQAENHKRESQTIE